MLRARGRTLEDVQAGLGREDRRRPEAAREQQVLDVGARDGREALDEALSPGSRLGDAPAFRDAAAKLSSGVRPSYFVDVEKLRGLAGRSGHGHDLQQRLKAFGAVVGGATLDGDVTRGEAVATLP